MEDLDSFRSPSIILQDIIGAAKEAAEEKAKQPVEAGPTLPHEFLMYLQEVFRIPPFYQQPHSALLEKATKTNASSSSMDTLTIKSTLSRISLSL